MPRQQVTQGRAIGTDPEVQVGKRLELLATGVTIVNVHTGQPDPETATAFYGERVLPRFRQPAVAARG